MNAIGVQDAQPLPRPPPRRSGRLQPLQQRQQQRQQQPQAEDAKLSPPQAEEAELPPLQTSLPIWPRRSLRQQQQAECQRETDGFEVRSMPVAGKQLLRTRAVSANELQRRVAGAEAAYCSADMVLHVHAAGELAAELRQHAGAAPAVDVLVRLLLL